MLWLYKHYISTNTSLLRQCWKSSAADMKYYQIYKCIGPCRSQFDCDSINKLSQSNPSDVNRVNASLVINGVFFEKHHSLRTVEEHSIAVNVVVPKYPCKITRCAYRSVIDGIKMCATYFHVVGTHTASLFLLIF